MVDLVLKAAQIRLAPREVKEWIRSVVLAELALAPGPERGQDETAEACLAEFTVEDAGRVLDHIRDDYLAAQVFLELGREPAHQYAESPELHRIPVTDILHHTRFGDAQHLTACLDRIAQAFQEVRRDPSVTLFAFDRMGGLYFQDTTRQSSKALWQALVTSRLTPASELPGHDRRAHGADPRATRYLRRARVQAMAVRQHPKRSARAGVRRAQLRLDLGHCDRVCAAVNRGLAGVTGVARARGRAHWRYANGIQAGDVSLRGAGEDPARGVAAD